MRKMDVRPTHKSQKGIVNIGTALMIVILMGLSFAVIAALAITSAKNNYDLSNNLANHTTEYYEACNEAYEIIDQNNWKDMSFEVYLNDTQKLVVTVEDKEITNWAMENEAEWGLDETLPVMQ